MSVLMVAVLEQPSNRGTLNLGRCGVRLRDRLAARYFADRYEPRFSIGLKLLLLMIESDLNTNRHFLPLTEGGHEMPTFRARVVTLYHALTSMRRIFERYPDSDTIGSRPILSLLQENRTRRLLDQGKGVRNRCVHYEMNDPRIVPDQALPMFGIVESVIPGVTWQSFNQDVLEVSDRLGDYLSRWRLTRPR